MIVTPMDDMDDIPVAARDAALGKGVTPTTRTPLLRWVILAIVIGSGLGAGVALRGIQSNNPSANSLKPTDPGTREPIAAANAPAANAPVPNASASPSAPADTLLNHYKYAEAPPDDLVAVSSDGGIKLRKAAAASFNTMVADAAAAGVSIVPLSGFRTIAEQRQLYFDVKAERGQTAEERAAWSAPPGYSEHHTGYTIDIGDASDPSLHLNQDFDKSPASLWMVKNAAKYSFELSFPKGNNQGVSYEPWHWRYVGDQHSLETFYKVRK
jgi:zinc D-Ala-D-Ala carboxypeptidase